MNSVLDDFPADRRIPSPGSVLGFDPGTRPLRHDEIVRYAESLAGASKRVALTTYGWTHEARPLIHLSIGNEGNIARLEAIAEATRRLGDPRVEQHASEAIPASVWIGCSIHGDELSGADAGVALAYRIAAGEDELAVRLRSGLVVHIDPAVNPDGRERALAQVTAFASKVPDHEASGIAHTLRWPRGRGNHYLFDLNRDLVAQIHPETRARIGAFLRLVPQLVIELHEMGYDDTFLYASPGDPLNPYLPTHAQAWWDRLARAGSAALTAAGESSYRGEWNEVFYPGYMDIWPAYHGAIPVIFEQPNTAGSPVRQRNGRTLTYGQAVGNQYVSLLGYLDEAARDVDRLLADWAAARATATRGRAGRDELGYVLSSVDPTRVQWVVEALLSQGVEVQLDVTQPDRYLVRLDQPAAALARNLLDEEVPIPPDFLEAERARLDATGQGTLYDVTAWSLPLVAGVSAELVRGPQGATWEPITTLPEATGGVRSEGAYGYLFTDDAFRLTAPLLRAGARLHVALDAFKIGETDWPRGAILVRRGENADSVDALDTFAREARVPVIGVDSPLVDDGPDLGGHRFPLAVPPRIGVTCGDGVEPSSYGAIWHALDSAGTPMSGLDVGQLKPADLARYTVLVLPDTIEDSNGYEVAFGSTLLDQLRAWVTIGGTLIALAGGARFIAREALGLGGLRYRSDEAVARYMPHGALIWTEVSTHHWLTVGAEQRIAVMHRAGGVVDAPIPAEAPVRFAPRDTLHASGLVWPEAAELIAGTACIAREAIGSGQVVLFATDPVFRGFTLATARLFMNAVHFGPGLGASHPHPW